MASNRTKDRDYVHYRVLKLLQESPEMTQREMAEKLGISSGGMHYCLNSLIDKGMVKLANFTTSKHKLGYFYLLTPEGIAQKAAMTRRFLKLKMEEYHALKAEIECMQMELGEETITEGEPGVL